VPDRPDLPLPSRLLLVRHAESQGNVADRAAYAEGADRLVLTHRDADMPLSDTGRREAVALGRAWATMPAEQRPTLLLTSPYERAERTALLALDAAGWDVPLARDERLRERDLGLLDGWTRQGIESHFPEEAKRRAWVGKFYYRPPGGEGWADVAARVRQVLASLRLDHGGERVAVVSHLAVVMNFRYVLEAMTEAEVLEVDRTTVVANASVTTYVGDGAALRLETVNDTRHLGGGER
jgi:broad specificity phosphatase PhoE